MIAEILRERIDSGEDEWTEFKKEFGSASAILPSVVAFANGLFEGWVIFGATERGEMVGVTDAPRLAEQLRRTCQQQCDPPLDVIIETVAMDAVEVLVLRVKGAKDAKPYRQKERETYWIRRGGRNEVVNAAEALAFVEQSYQVFSPALHTLHVAGFRSLYDMKMVLKPLNIIIGPNASGKSNVFKALNFVRDLVSEGIGTAHQEIGRHLFWYGVADESEAQCTLGLKMAVPEQRGRLNPHYEVEIQWAENRLAIANENLELRLDPAGPKEAFINRQGGTITRYAERIDDGEGKKVDSPEYVPVKGKLPLRIAALATYGRESTFAPLQNVYKFILGWRFLRVDPKAARASVIPFGVEGELPALQDDAGNLSAFLYALQNHDALDYLWDEIQERLRHAIQTPNAIKSVPRPSLTGGIGKVEMTFSERFFPDQSIPAESMSDGTISLLAMLAGLIGDPDATLLCLEEPDQGLHPHLMGRLADAIRSVVDLDPEPGDEEFRRPQVIITTHSPDFMDCFDLRAERDYLQVFIARRDTEGKTYFEPVTAEEFEPWLDQYRLGSLARKNILDQGVF